MKPEADRVDTLRVAVIGSGVAGLTAAWLLSRRHRVDLYEREARLGGHTRTLTLPDGPDAGTPVDTGFIVMNHRNYPLLTRVFEQLGVDVRDSDMSFSYQCRQTGYFYSGTGLRGLFAQPANIVRPRHLGMIRDIMRFNREAARDLAEGRLSGKTLGQYLAEGAYGPAFAEQYLLAMGGAIWSSPPDRIEEFPAEPYIRFFEHHGLLTLNDRPQWKYVAGGSQTYVARMRERLSGDVHTNRAVRGLRRTADGAELSFTEGSPVAYDRAVVAVHADEALALLDDPTPSEQAELGAWTYLANEAVLHRDATPMPRARAAWASWNFVRPAAVDGGARPVSVTYWMNRLQNLETRQPCFVSLNLADPVREEDVVDRHVFTHPCFTFDALHAQGRLPSLNGVRNTYFCGSYFGFGFHEDAVRSSVAVAEQLGVRL